MNVRGFLFVPLCLVASAGVATPAGPARTRTSINEDWRFLKAEAAGENPSLDEGGWRRVDLPHDWGVEGPFDIAHPGETGKLPWWGVAWYRKHLAMSTEDRGRRVYLDVDGAMSDATVWLNGQKVGGWPYGYASWRLDLTEFLRDGDNVLAIRLDNRPDSSRWYPGGGLYRNVWLVKTAPVHVAHWGTFVTTPQVDARSATVKMDVTIDNKGAGAARVEVTSHVHEGAGETRGRRVASSRAAKLDIEPGASGSASVTVPVSKPRLWDIRTPQLYTAVTVVKRGGQVVDEYETTFGIRTVRFDADKGFFLNGERVEIKGVCNHHDLGALGAAFNTRAAERQLEILREMGTNAIRTSHNPPAPELLDLTDRMGLLVMVEAFDAWKTRKKANDYNRLYDEWHEKDLRAMVRRDRNHPSIFMWSTGNEVQEQGRPEGPAMAARHTAIIHDEDRTRPVTGGHNNRAAGVSGYQKAFDVFGYNYRTDSYGKYREVNPDLPMIASETSSTVSSRGEYFFPVTDDRAGGRSDFQLSSYDLYTPGWGISPDGQWKALEQNPWISGEFVWTGFDYLGEPTPYNRDSTNLLNFSDPKEQEKMKAELAELGRIRPPSRSSYFGIVDLAGFPKDRFFLYQSHWRPDLPMAHILPHWTWPERVGQVTPVHVYTSGDEAELFLNGRSLGRKKKVPLEYRLRWDGVGYVPGELKVVAYKAGKEWATATQKTAGAAASLDLCADRPEIRADGRDLAFVTVRVHDRTGVLAPRAKNRIRFSLSGPGEIVATDNGDATSFESFQSTDRQAYNGLALVIVRARRGEPGQLTLRAESEGLIAGEAAIRTR